MEISVQPGIHIVAIFHENRGSAHVNDMLARLGLGIDSRGEQDALVTDFGPQKVVSMIRKEGALPILAHIDDHKGAWQELHRSGQTFQKLWQAGEFAAVEVVGNGLPDAIGQDPYTHVPAYYWSSDNPHPDNPTKHSHLGIGSRCSYFKLDHPITWEGLRLCFHDPAVRIRPFAPDFTGQNAHPVIERVRVQGGFLKNLDLTFNPNLNCVIGGRGTGKSTLLEILRYAFDVAPKTNANQKQANSLISHAFPAGSSIVVNFRAGGTAYHLERGADQSPKVFRDGGPDPLNISPAQLLPLQCYGQKEIIRDLARPRISAALAGQLCIRGDQAAKRKRRRCYRTSSRKC